MGLFDKAVDILGYEGQLRKHLRSVDVPSLIERNKLHIIHDRHFPIVLYHAKKRGKASAAAAFELVMTIIDDRDLRDNELMDTRIALVRNACLMLGGVAPEKWRKRIDAADAERAVERAALEARIGGIREARRDGIARVDDTMEVLEHGEIPKDLALLWIYLGYDHLSEHDLSQLHPDLDLAAVCRWLPALERWSLVTPIGTGNPEPRYKRTMPGQVSDRQNAIVKRLAAAAADVPASEYS